jgi:hypothetical protein
MFKTLMIILLGLIINSSVFAQDIVIPDWIKGTWNNSYESNTKNFEYWTFSNDSIYVNKGFPINKSNRTCFNEIYSDFKIKTETSESLFRLSFIKDKNLVTYEFRLQKVYYSDKPVLTYLIEIDGEIIRQHSTSANLVLTKTVYNKQYGQ